MPSDSRRYSSSLILRREWCFGLPSVIEVSTLNPIHFSVSSAFEMMMFSFSATEVVKYCEPFPPATI
jgi:hypothetical protein